ncbi:MAG: hypothetical protein SGJ00_02745 [bacterium]|nr:hypothetical protein [bacterium]
MKISIDKNEHYLWVNTEATTIAESLALELVQTAKKEMETGEWAYVIFEFSMANQIDLEAKTVLQTYNLTLQENLGMALCVADQAQWHEEFEEIGLVLTPTLGEAVEYIYMDQLEKDFLTDSES